VIFVNANVPMYLIGADHPHKVDSQRLLERLALDRERLVTSAEVFQEILHRYRALQRQEFIQPAFDSLLGVVDEVFAVDLEDVEAAKSLLLAQPSISARDALHAATMRRRGVARVLSFDTGFDQVAGLSRVTAANPAG
jgi:uncharacterized protein